MEESVKQQMEESIEHSDEMTLWGNWFRADVRTYAGRCAARAWAHAIVAEDGANMAIARAVLKEVGREG